jgi:hypothetical protein
LIVHPRLREIQLQRRQPSEPAGDQRRRDRDLAIGNLAHGAAVLTLHADRGRALLRQARVVDRQDAVSYRQPRAQLLPERPYLPRRVRDEMLQPLIRPRIAEPSMHRLHRLALAVVQQTLPVAAGVRPVRATTEAADEVIEKRAESRQQCARPGIGHASEGTESAGKVQVKLTK